MRLGDYLVEALRDKGVTHFFGYQGTMISYFVDSITHTEGVENHSCYNEQGAAFAACGLAQSTDTLSVAYATSGPGAINLLSGVANAYYDSLPVLFITGQVNTYEYLPNARVRQHSFQEANVVSMAKPITKYAVKIEDPAKIKYEVEKACWIATHGRSGAVLLDIPMDIQRADINPEELEGYIPPENQTYAIKSIIKEIEESLSAAKRPALILGNGVDRESASQIVDFAHLHDIPVLTSLLGKDLVRTDEKVCFGYIGGAYGIRVANLIAAKKADLLICFGVSLVTRQTGTNVKLFAPDTKIIRLDIDSTSFDRKIGKNDVNHCVDVKKLSPMLNRLKTKNFGNWLNICCECRDKLETFDSTLPERKPNNFIASAAKYLPEGAVIASDVGQHMMWIAQSMPVKHDQRFLFSGGHGAMGYALPAAIGASYGSCERALFCFAGDGAFQMNIQELEWVVREQIPIKMIILNNHALGMVRAQQKMYFNDEFEGTSENHHYSVGKLSAILTAYGIRAVDVDLDTDLAVYKSEFEDNMPFAVVVDLPEDSFAYPKTILGNPIYNQSPFVPEKTLDELIAL